MGKKLQKLKNWKTHRPANVSTGLFVTGLLTSNLLTHLGLIATDPITGVIEICGGLIYLGALMISSNKSSDKKQLINQMAMEISNKKKQDINAQRPEPNQSLLEIDMHAGTLDVDGEEVVDDAAEAQQPSISVTPHLQ